jgi:predicted O-methyltransferase YrrM
LIAKLTKHLTILRRRAGQATTLRSMREQPSKPLRAVVRALQQAAGAEPFAGNRAAAFARCEAYRKELLQNHELVDYTVFDLPDTATVSSVCRQATSPPQWARLLYLLVDELQAKHVLEIGTNLGVSGSYILEALRLRPGTTFTTMDGVPKYVAIAGRQFATLTDPDRFEIIEGNYDLTFPELLARDPEFDLLFIDGNHREGPTVAYFEQLLNKSTRPAVFVFDDINWSPGMLRAWDAIRSHPSVRYSIDLWKLGIVIVEASDEPARHYALHLAY